MFEKNMDNEIKKILEIMKTSFDDSMEDFYDTHIKLSRLFKAYDKESELYSIITKISPEIYPGDVRVFLNIYHELTNDNDSEKVLLNRMETAAKLCNRIVNRATLELQLEESNQVLMENDELKDISNKLASIAEQSLNETDYYLNRYGSTTKQDSPTYH